MHSIRIKIRGERGECEEKEEKAKYIYEMEMVYCRRRNQMTVLISGNKKTTMNQNTIQNIKFNCCNIIIIFINQGSFELNHSLLTYIGLDWIGFNSIPFPYINSFSFIYEGMQHNTTVIQ